MAVAVVLAYHAQMPWVRGAFLGISQFFTLSGFLITSILLRTVQERGEIDLRRFWARRYRRLMPAAYLTLAGVVVFGATVATEQQLDTLAGGIAAAAAQVANWYFVITDQSYVALFSAPSPVQHFWSLAIEEQFYLLLPLLLVLVHRYARSNRTATAVLAGGAVASTALMIVLFRAGASLDRLYYGTDTRAAELLVGAVLATVLQVRPFEPGPRARRLVAGLSIVAFATVLWGWTAVAITDRLLWQGGFFVFALLTVVLVLDVLGGGGPVARGFALAPVAAMGRISYGLYLYHWPIFLWLTADRTGLDRWPLFGLRLSLTFAVAIASYHLLEMPIRERRWPATPGLFPRILVPTAVLLVVGGVLVSQRTVDTDLAGLGEQVGDAPIAGLQRSSLRVLVVADAEGQPFVHELEDYDGQSPDLTVAVAPLFSCAGIDRAAGETACSNWATEWPDLVADFEPDVVLFHVTDWPREEVAALAGTDDLAAMTSFVREALEAGFDLLAADGATVVWSQELPSFGRVAGIRGGPFFRAALGVTSSRADARRLHAPVDAAASTVDELQLYAPRQQDDVPRVLVVGDSTARTFGYGFERWAAREGAAVVWSAGIEGCGLIEEGVVRDSTSREVPVGLECQDVAAGWRRQVEEFDPDLVVVSSLVFDLQGRRVEGWPGFLAPGDAPFDDFLTDTYLDVVDTLSASGAEVLWFQNPCAEPLFGTLGDPATLDTERIRYVNDVILGRVAKARPGLHVFDLFSVLCPDGKFVSGLGGVKTVRPDGIHLGPEGSLWLAEHYGAAILETGLG